MKGTDINSWNVRAKELIHITGLSGFEKARPHELSGGMQSRTALIRALIYSPEILIMDEPSASLDEITRLRLNQEMAAIFNKSGTTVIFVTHIVEEAVMLADRVFIMSSKPCKLIE